jgi:hypothetical protein
MNLFRPVWQKKTIVVKYHQLDVVVTVVVKSWPKVHLDKITLLLWCEAHSLEEMLVDVAISGLILSSQSPK